MIGSGPLWRLFCLDGPCDFLTSLIDCDNVLRLMQRFLSTFVILSILTFGLTFSGMLFFDYSGMNHGMSQDLSCVNHCVSLVMDQTIIPFNLSGIVATSFVYLSLIVVFVACVVKLFTQANWIGILLRRQHFQTVILRD